MRKRRAHLAVMTGLPWLFLQPAVQAQPVGWLRFDSSIQGEATESQHPQWIEIYGFGADSRRTVSGGGANRAASDPEISEITLTKRVDRSTPQLFREAATGTTPYPNVTLDLTSGGTTPLARLVLENVLLARQSFDAVSGGPDRPSETITLSFTRITFSYNITGSAPSSATYNLESAQATYDGDHDGMPDSWENAYGINTGGNDAAADPDGDGFTNLQEFQLGTHPKSGASFFKATLAVSPSTPGFYQLSWNSVPGKTYVIEWSPDLKTPFSALRTVTAAAATSTESVARNGTLGFYRVRPQ